MKIHGAAFFSLILAAGCGAKDDNKSDQLAPMVVYTGQTFSLVGVNSTKWVGKCGVVEDRDNRSRKTMVNLQENTFTASTSYYDGLECAENLIRVTYHDHYYNVKKEDSERLAGWTTIAYSVEAIMLELHREVLVMKYNDNNAFGLSNWNVRVPQNVSGRSFDGNSEKELEKNAARERTFKVEGETLFFAKYESQVPVASDEYPYEKQP